jgi:hypothetical protein
VSPGNTSTGGVLEAMVLPALQNGGYSYKTQVHIGKRLGVGRHMIDVIATKDGRSVLVSMKWQQVSGTAEQKVPYEVICLMEAVEAGEFTKAYLVLGGDKWSLRDMYISGGLAKFLAHEERVEILTLESFVAKANSGKL